MNQTKGVGVVGGRLTETRRVHDSLEPLNEESVI